MTGDGVRGVATAPSVSTPRRAAARHVGNVTASNSHECGGNHLQKSASKLAPNLVGEAGTACPRMAVGELAKPPIVGRPEAVTVEGNEPVAKNPGNLSDPTDKADETRLAVLADLLISLSETDRRDVINELSTQGRKAIAKTLITRRD